MKKKLLILLAIMVAVTTVSWGFTSITNNKEIEVSEKDKLTIVTSFYPMYIAAQNIVADMEQVELINLTENTTGCLHDYQLTTKDMRKLEEADVLIINGGEMESFLEDIIKAYPELYIINASEGIPMLESGHSHDHAGHENLDEGKEEVELGEDIDEEHVHSGEDIEGEEHVHIGEVTEDEHNHAEEEHDHSAEINEESDHIHSENEHEEEESPDHDHDHGSVNGHVWLNPSYYRMQINTISNNLSEYDKANAGAYTHNAEIYEEKITQLEGEMKETFPEPINAQVIIFHDAFAYLAETIGIEVVYQIEMDGETSLNTGQIAEIIDEIKYHDIRVLLTEVQFEDTIANRIANETDAEVYIIDSLVTGEFDKNAYVDGMKHNIEVLKEIFHK